MEPVTKPGEAITGYSGVVAVILLSFGLAITPFMYGIGTALKPGHFNAGHLIEYIGGIFVLTAILLFIFSFAIQKVTLEGNILTIRKRLFFSRTTTLDLSQVVAVKICTYDQGRGRNAPMCIVTDVVGSEYELPLYANRTIVQALATPVQKWLYDPHIKVDAGSPPVIFKSANRHAYGILTAWYRGVPRDIDAILDNPGRLSASGPPTTPWIAKKHVVGYILGSIFILLFPTIVIVAVALSGR
jgi:hypothetical protein